MNKSGMFFLMTVWICAGLPSLYAQSINLKQAEQPNRKKVLGSHSDLRRQRVEEVLKSQAKEEPNPKSGRTAVAGLSNVKSPNASTSPPSRNASVGIPSHLASFQKVNLPASTPSYPDPSYTGPAYAPVAPAPETGIGLRFSDIIQELPGPIGQPQESANSAAPATAPQDQQEAQALENSEEESDAEEEEESEEESEETLFRPEFHEWGPLVLESIYTGEVFNNTRGGISTQNATRYRGNLDLTFSLDFEKAKLWSGGEIFVYFHQSHGTTLTPDFVGDGQYYSNIDTGPRPQQLSRLGEYWYRHTSPDEAMAIKIGRQDANADFAFCDLSGDFLNSSFVTIPNIPMPFWPFQSLGISGVNQVNDQLKLGGGVYDQSHNMEQWWTNSSDQGVFAISQADWTPFAAVEDAKLTLIRLGGWYTTADTDAIGQSSLFPDNYGLYSTVDRMLFTEHNAPDQGLGGFFQFSWAPDDRNQVDRAYAAGLIYRGLLNNRDRDTCGIAYTGIMFSDLLESETGQTSEDVMELFYKARLRRGLSIQPDVQYIARPSGQERDALVVGIRFESNF